MAVEGRREEEREEKEEDAQQARKEGAGLIFDASACYSPLEDGAGLISSDWLDAFLFR